MPAPTLPMIDRERTMMPGAIPRFRVTRKFGKSNPVVTRAGSILPFAMPITIHHRSEQQQCALRQLLFIAYQAPMEIGADGMVASAMGSRCRRGATTGPHSARDRQGIACRRTVPSHRDHIHSRFTVASQAQTSARSRCGKSVSRQTHLTAARDPTQKSAIAPVRCFHCTPPLVAGDGW